MAKFSHLLRALFVLALISVTHAAVSEIHAYDDLDAVLKEHIRSLDAGEDASKIADTVRQASTGPGPDCVSTSKCYPVRSCGVFECSYCSKLRCLPSREVERTKEIFKITCERSPCAPDVTGSDRKCCTRNFCITNTCKPAKLPVISLAGKSVGDSFTVKSVIKIPKKLKTDLYLLSDTTGSMSEEIAAVRKQMEGLINALKDTTSGNIAFGVGEFRDETELGDGFRNVQPLALNYNKSIDALSELKARGGGDGPEGGLVALYKLATDADIGWREETRKIVVFYGDAPQHEPTCLSGKILKRGDVIDALHLRNITVVSVSFQGGLNRPTYAISCDKKINRDKPTAGNQGKEIASKTFGAHKTVTAADPKSTEVQKAITTAVDESKLFLHVANSTCEAITIEYVPSFPTMVTLGAEVAFDQKITINPDICSHGIEECRTYFSVAGPLVAEQTISTIDVLGCDVF